MFSDWLAQHSWLLATIAAGSTVLLLASILATPWLVARLPENYLLQREAAQSRHPLMHMIIVVLSTLLGGALVLLGLIMLVTPGPGLVTLLVGISLASFPGKRRLLLNLASRHTVFSSLNWMRKRRGKVPFIHPQDENN